MKLFLVPCLLLSLLSVRLFAQEGWGSVAPITYAFTETVEVGALAIKDETGRVLTATEGGGTTRSNSFSVVTTTNVADFGAVPTKTVSTLEAATKLAVYRLGNSEILDFLVALEVIPSKAGYSLQALMDVDGNFVGVFARSGTRTVDGVFPTLNLEGFSMVGGAAVSVSSGRVSRVTSTNLSTQVETLSGSSTTTSSFRSALAVGLPAVLGAPEVPLTGLMTGTSRVVVKLVSDESGQTVYFVNVPGTLRVDRLFAYGDSYLSEGVLTTSAATMVDLAFYTAGSPNQ